MIIYHNPRCRKSRETLKLIQESGADPRVVEYLKYPLNAGQIKSLLHMAGLEVEQLIRKKEKIYREQYKGKVLSEEQWLEILAKHPQLIERPIVVKDDKAVLARPPVLVKTLLK